MQKDVDNQAISLVLKYGYNITPEAYEKISTAKKEEVEKYIQIIQKLYPQKAVIELFMVKEAIKETKKDYGFQARRIKPRYHIIWSPNENLTVSGTVEEIVQLVKDRYRKLKEIYTSEKGINGIATIKQAYQYTENRFLSILE